MGVLGVIMGRAGCGENRTSGSEDGLRKPSQRNLVEGAAARSYSYMQSLVKGLFFYLYMIEDIYSRKIVGWEVHAEENGELAAELLQRTVWAEKCVKEGLVLHSDNGSPMKCLTMQTKMYDLGVSGSRSRPGVSNDNPYSESLFRTVKYCPRWPSEGFKSLEEARQWVLEFVDWYNNKHKHSRIKFVTPNQRHRGEDIAILTKRKELYDNKKAENPTRWSGSTRNWDAVGKVELNPENEAKPEPKKDAA
jgi:putative transposase